MDGRIQSHFCWVDENVIFGYGEHNNKKGFFSCNVHSGMIVEHKKLTQVHPKDGHPTIYGDWIIIDSYPDISRMQQLIAYNYKTEEIKILGTFFHDLRHRGFTRCDLHPRFASNGIYIDTIYSEKRELAVLNVNL